MPRRPGLGEFLRGRRGRLSLADAGLVDHGDRRRVSGLRREELAGLAGVSLGYYTRLEQGHGANASDAVLDALATALRLDDHERAHLRALARTGARQSRRRDGERLHPRIGSLLHALGDTPALVLGRRHDVLAWNRTGHALLARHVAFDSPTRPDERPNWSRLFFLDPRVIDLYVDWETKARATVADLRELVGRNPADHALAGLIADLTRRSPSFAALWNSHPVRGCAHHVQRYRHPVVGDLTLTDDLLVLPDDDGQRLAVFHAAPGSPSTEALRLLARAAGEPDGTG